ncbi:hypothetical protein L204_104713 [Cryptococcus depauperatus]|nr:hypothetical protein L204_03584 [Cryptococcus depauperatus CBS 7855]
MSAPHTPSSTLFHEPEMFNIDLLALTGLDTSMSDIQSPQRGVSGPSQEETVEGGCKEKEVKGKGQRLLELGGEGMEVDEQLLGREDTYGVTLLQQLQAIHMQSPLGFRVDNPPMQQVPLMHSLQNGHTQKQQLHLQGDNLGQSEMAPWAQPEGMPQTSQSAYSSPATHATFMPAVHRNSLPPLSSKSPIEQLQEQQRQFQEQLAMLQRQQLEMQATAAAVIAASSPYVGSSTQGSNTTTTPSVCASPAAFFSPLTSPALEATNRTSHHFSPAFGGQKSRAPHPLSTMPSPALNPTGSSGGASQTLSPALNPHNAVDMADPEYMLALNEILDSNGRTTPVGEQQPVYPSPSAPSGNALLSSPALYPSNVGTGPHRQSLPVKSRPSPMLKPSNHRSSHRNSGNTSVPTSPAVQRYHPDASMPSALNSGSGGQSGFLPPSAIENRVPSNVSVTSSSTPSPVNLNQMMPPPPVPAGNNKSRKAVLPMTPALLMNLSPANSIQPQERHKPIQGYSVPPPSAPKRQNPGSSVSTMPKATGKGGQKRAAGSKMMSVGNPRRALAARPHSGVGVRAGKYTPSYRMSRIDSCSATKAAAAALLSEPEIRKTSHKAAEQKRRDSLKAGFDELRLLLPPINTEALDPLSGEPIPGSSAPRLLPKSSLVPDDNPNRGVSKVALLRFGNEYIGKLQERLERRDMFIEKLRDEVRRLRDGSEKTVRTEEDEDLLDYDWREGEDDEFGEESDDLEYEEDSEEYGAMKI